MQFFKIHIYFVQLYKHLLTKDWLLYDLLLLTFRVLDYLTAFRRVFQICALILYKYSSVQTLVTLLWLCNYYFFTYAYFELDKKTVDNAHGTLVVIELWIPSALAPAKPDLRNPDKLLLFWHFSANWLDIHIVYIWLNFNNDLLLCNICISNDSSTQAPNTSDSDKIKMFDWTL